jgi:hypothetical protein
MNSSPNDPIKQYTKNPEDALITKIKLLKKTRHFAGFTNPSQDAPLFLTILVKAIS